MQPFVKIPARLDATNKAQVKALAVFFALKQFKYNSALPGFFKQYKQYAKALNISPNNLRAKIQQLFLMDLIKRDGDHLHLVSFKTLCENLGAVNISNRTHVSKYKFYKHTGTDVKEIEYFIKAAAIHENLENQQYKVYEKALIYETTQAEAFLKNPNLFPTNEGAALLVKRASQRSDKGLKRLARKVIKNNAEQIINKWRQAQTTRSREGYQRAFINPTITLSCGGMARVAIGKGTTRAAGFYLAAKLIEYGFIDQYYTRHLEKCNHAQIKADLNRFNLWDNDSNQEATAGLFTRKTKRKDHNGHLSTTFIECRNLDGIINIDLNRKQWHINQKPHKH